MTVSEPSQYAGNQIEAASRECGAVRSEFIAARLPPATPAMTGIAGGSTAMTGLAAAAAGF